MLARKGIRTVFKKGKTYRTRSPAEVIALARQMKTSLKPYAKKIEIVGSIRRKRPDPVDVDIVMVPKDKLKVAEVLEKKGKLMSKGSESIAVNVEGVKVDLRFSPKEEWSTQLLTYTGPHGGNIGMRKVAQKKGWKLSQHGLYDRAGKRIPVSSEREVYDKLGIIYRSPEERGIRKYMAEKFRVKAKTKFGDYISNRSWKNRSEAQRVADLQKKADKELSNRGLYKEKSLFPSEFRTKNKYSVVEA